MFQLDVRARELKKRGVKVRLPDQPFQVLALLLERRGEIVTREELQRRLWSTDTFVDFDLALNSAVRKVREALGDSAEQPRYVETLPRLGYRFIAPIELTRPAKEPPSQEAPPVEAPPTVPDPPRRRIVAWATSAIPALVAAILIFSGSLTVGRPVSTYRAPEVDPDAYALFLKGVEAAGRVTYEGSLDAASYFEQAITRQPDYAQAYERLAAARLQHIWAGPLYPRDVLPGVIAAAQHAVTLDDTLAEAHRILAFASRMSGDYARADLAIARARDVARPTQSLTLQAAALEAEGRFEEAVVVAEEALKLDPRVVSRRVFLSEMYLKAGQPARALAELQRALAAEPGRPNVLFQLGATLAVSGDAPAATAALEEANERTGNPRFRAYLAYAYVLDGEMAQASAILDELLVLRERQYVSSFGIALIQDALGDYTAAASALDRAYSEQAVEFRLLHLYPPFQTLVSDPRYVGPTARAWPERP